MSKFTSIDLFAGIGGIRLGFEKAFGDDIQTVYASEWDEHAVKTYKHNFDKDKFDIAGDITKIDENDVPPFNICLAGFPCQAFSLAGQRKGFNDDYKGMSRGTLFFDVARICERHKPDVIFCENVKGLEMHDRGNTYSIIKKTLEEIGYTVFQDVLNSKDFGVPQNRERIYIVAFRNDIAPDDFIFPQPTDSSKRIKDILEKDPVSVRYYLSTTYVDTLRKHKERHAAKGNGFGYEIRSDDGIAGAIVCGGMGRERNLLIDNRLTNFTPVTHIRGEVNREGIRKMTPREWARLQGYPETYQFPVADVHAYKQLGNSVTVNVIEAIAKEIKAVLEKQDTKVKSRKKGVDSMKLSGNKGEWSEIYTLLKLLADGRLYAADENLNKNDDIYYEIIKIFRKENVGDLIFAYDETGTNVRIIEENDNRVFVLVPRVEFADTTGGLLKHIINAKTATFPHIETATFLNKIQCSKLKAPAPDKSDISMQVRDVKAGFDPILGFSIKSRLGRPSTLLNPGKTTNFTYKIIGNIDDNVIQNFNAESEFRNKFEILFAAGCDIEFVSMDNETFSNNLALIDSDLPNIVALLLKECYVYGQKNILAALNAIKVKNPLGYNLTAHPFYEYKFKKLLAESALGMVPSKPWTGKADATGGYIVVREDGEVLCYHLYNRNEFENYLLNNTKFDTPSTSRYEFGQLYEENGEYLVKLNLQIRFIK